MSGFSDWYDKNIGQNIRNSGFGSFMSGFLSDARKNFGEFGNYLTGQGDINAQLEAQKKLLDYEQQFNSAEAAKNREWQTEMSNTAIQRQVADLKAAGLNPWLALQNGMSGAAVGSTGNATSSAGSVGKRSNTWSDMVTAANKLVGQGNSIASNGTSAALKVAALVVMAMLA